MLYMSALASRTVHVNPVIIHRATATVLTTTNSTSQRKFVIPLEIMAPVKADLEQMQQLFKGMMSMPAFGVDSKIDLLNVVEVVFDAEDVGERRFVKTARMVHSGIAQQEWTNQRGLAVHGGFIAWLVDTCSSALMIGLSSPTFWHQTGGVTLNLNINYFHPITVGTKLKIVSKLLKVSNTIAWIDCEIYDDKGKLLASAVHTKSHPATIKAKL